MDRPDARRNSALYESARSTQSDWADKAAENLEYYFGAHWTSAQKAVLAERGQQPIAIQTIFQIVEQATGMLTANRPGFRGVARENSDRKVASILSDLFQWMWQQSRGQHRLVNVVRDNYVQGRGVALAYVDWNADFGKGEVMWRDLDPKEVFPDPRSSDPLWDDAAYVLVRRLLTLKQVAQTWGEEVGELVRANGNRDETYPYTGTKSAHRTQIIHPSDVQAGWLSNFDTDETYEIIERYEKVKRQAHRLMDLETGRDEILDDAAFQQRITAPAYIRTVAGEDEIITDPLRVATLDSLYQQVGAVFHMHQPPPMVSPDGQMQPQAPFPMPGDETTSEGAIPGSTTALQPVTVGELVLSGQIPHVPFQRDRVRVVCSSGSVLLFEPYELPTGHYPVVAFPNTSNRTPYPASDVDRLKDLQDLINKTQSLILAHQATSTNMKVFYPEGSIDDLQKYEQEWSKSGSALIPYNPAYGSGGSTPGGIVIAAPPQLPASLFLNIDRAIALMERIAGIYAFQQGQLDGAPQTFRGTLAMDEFGLRRMKHKLDTIYGSLERLGSVMLDFAQAVYTDRKVIRITQPDGKVAEQEIGGYAISAEGTVQRINDLTTGQYDVMIVAGSTLPSNRWALLETYLQMHERGLVDDIAVLRATEIPDAEEILERNSIMKQQAAALQQHAEQITSLQGDLQTWEREAMHSKQKAELEKFKSRLAKLEAETRKNVEVFRFGLDKDRARIQASEQLESDRRVLAADTDESEDATETAA